MSKFEDIDLDRLVEEVLAGKEIARETAMAILNCPDERLADLLAATRTVREAAFGRRVKICMLRNAQSGICPEDCSYCSQSKISKADIPVYKMQSVAQLMEGARIAVESGARQADLFNAVNSIFVNGYLTTAGWDWARTRELIERAGYEPEPA